MLDGPLILTAAFNSNDWSIHVNLGLFAATRTVFSKHASLHVSILWQANWVDFMSVSLVLNNPTAAVGVDFAHLM